uniref:Uncharacterized protein n=1 Tax=Manihot esculenta TaxID=3983 RepID=A0A2C9WR19_MANES
MEEVGSFSVLQIPLCICVELISNHHSWFSKLLWRFNSPEGYAQVATLLLAFRITHPNQAIWFLKIFSVWCSIRALNLLVGLS